MCLSTQQQEDVGEMQEDPSSEVEPPPVEPAVRGFHDFRHFRATQWLMNGFDVNTVKELLGHVDIHTTMRYLHCVQAHAESAVREAEKRKSET